MSLKLQLKTISFCLVFTRYFMVSGLKGSRVKDLSQYLMDQTVKKPWEEDPFTMGEEAMKNISFDVVRESLLDHTA